MSDDTLSARFVKLFTINRASSTNLDGITRTINRLSLFGFTIWKWRTKRKAHFSDWQSSKR